MTEQNMPQYDILQEYQEKKTMKKTFSRIGWSLFWLVAVWLVSLTAISTVFGVMEIMGIPALGFYEKYLLVFNELGLTFGIFAAMFVLRNLPKREMQGEKIGAGRFLKYILIGLAIGSIGNVIGSSILSFWNGATGNEAGTEVNDLLMGSEYWILLLMVGVFAPFLEEFFFRKLLIDHIRQYGELTCILTSGVLFALFHGNFTQFFYAFGLGALFAYVYLRSGSFVLTFLFHAIFNIVSGVLPAILMEMGEDAQMIYSSIYLILVLVGAVFLFIGLRKLSLKKGEIVISKKSYVSSAVWNLGMIVSAVMMIVIMIMSLFTE